MEIKGITDECFTDYKVPVMYIAFPNCTFKCDIENNCECCQNSSLAHEPNIEISKEKLIERYLANPITKGIVLAGLEPFDSGLSVLPFIDCLRREYKCNDPVIIYTGYTEEEIESGRFGMKHLSEQSQIQYWTTIKSYKNIIVKFGRYHPNEEPHYDAILGINLASSNQYAKEYNCENHT